jgi:hypothetical protein
MYDAEINYVVTCERRKVDEVSMFVSHTNIERGLLVIQKYCCIACTQAQQRRIINLIMRIPLRVCITDFYSTNFLTHLSFLLENLNTKELLFYKAILDKN